MCSAIKKYLDGNENLDKIRMVSVSGIDQIPSVLEGISTETLKEPLFIEFLSCAGGCINGPGTSVAGSTALKQLAVVDYAKPAENIVNNEVLETKATIVDGIGCGEVKEIPRRNPQSTSLCW